MNIKTKTMIVVVTLPFYGHLNVLINLINQYLDRIDFQLIVIGWNNIRLVPNQLTKIKCSFTEIYTTYDLQETDPIKWLPG